MEGFETKLTLLLENEEDIPFWESIFRSCQSDVILDYAYASKEERGKDKLIKNHVELLNKSMVLCIDSDFDYLLDADIFKHKNKKYIFQTYAYAVENHLLFPQNLNQLLTHLLKTDIGKEFDMVDFMQQFSKINYDFFKICLYFRKQKKENKITEEPSQITEKSLKNLWVMNINEGLEKVKHKIKQATEQIHRNYPAIDLTSIETMIQQVDIKEEETYLYLMAHPIFDNFLDLLEQITRKMAEKYYKTLPQDNEKSTLRAQYANQTGFSYTDKLRLSNNVKEQLKMNFQKCLINKNNHLFNRILDDVQVFLSC